jgi:predicted 3-demethylubiquinone-9 3-methyltransferase (glyoxalase superfamily)
MQKIIPHLWFDREAKEAAVFYTSVFPGSKIKGTATLYNTPSGTVDVVTFELLGRNSCHKRRPAFQVQ